VRSTRKRRCGRASTSGQIAAVRFARHSRNRHALSKSTDDGGRHDRRCAVAPMSAGSGFADNRGEGAVIECTAWITMFSGWSNNDHFGSPRLIARCAILLIEPTSDRGIQGRVLNPSAMNNACSARERGTRLNQFRVISLITSACDVNNRPKPRFRICRFHRSAGVPRLAGEFNGNLYRKTPWRPRDCLTTRAFRVQWMLR
jgi:hypothetical protein